MTNTRRRIGAAAVVAAATVATAALGSPGTKGPSDPGPDVVSASWSLAHDAAGESVHSVAVSGTALLAGTRYEGLLRVEGAAVSRPLASPLAAIVRSPSDPTLLVAGSWGEGVFRSADRGVSWAAEPGGPAASDVYSLAFSGADLFAGTSAGVFRRGAAGWEPRSSGLGARNVFSLLASPGRLYAGTEHGVFTSENGGAGWRAPGTGLGEGRVYALAASGTAVLAGTDLGLLRSTDGGAAWSFVAGGPPGPVRALAVAARQPLVLFAGGRDGVRLSRDGGVTWTAFSEGLVGESGKVLSLAVAGTCPEAAFAGTGSGLWERLQDCGGPDALDDVATTPQYTATRVAVLANDTDPDRDSLTVTAVTRPSHGSAVINADGTIGYTPDHTFKDRDSFEYTLSDGDELDTAKVTILEDGCGEEGLDALAGTPAEGAASRTIDRQVEPLVGGVDPTLAETLHDVNCERVVPVEDTVDEVLP